MKKAYKILTLTVLMSLASCGESSSITPTSSPDITSETPTSEVSSLEPSSSLESSSIPSSSIEEKHKFFMVGDSTMCSFENDSSDAIKYYPRVGFGTKMQNYLNANYEVVNLAISGRSAKSFLAEENYQILSNSIKEGDYLFIEFGHNDAKADEIRYSNPNGSYLEEGSFQNILYEKYISLAKEKGATPILGTPIIRRSSSGTYEEGSGNLHYFTGNDLFPSGDFGKAVRKVAEDTNTLLVDNLNNTLTYYTKIGKDQTMYLHAWNQDKSVDNTHLNNYGASVVAYMTAQDLVELGLSSVVKESIAEPIKEEELKVNPNWVEPSYLPPSSWSNNFTTTSDWHASMFGSLGSTDLSYYKVQETVDETSRNVVLGVKNDKGGKLSSSTDGLLMYFVQLEKDLDFTLEAKAQALILPTGKQAGFGLMARDEMYIDTKVSSMNGSYVACGGLKPNDADLNEAYFFARKEVSKYEKNKLEPNLEITLETELNLKLTKTDDKYIASINGIESEVENDLFKVDGQYIYVGVFVSRTYEVNFKDIKLTVI